MNMSNKKKIIISIIISAIVLAGVFVGIQVFSNTQEEIKIKDDVFADVSATWYRDFTYTTDASAKTITLTKYNKTAANVVIPNSATISGTKYTTIISNGLFRDNTSINSVEFESGVKADTTLARLFDGCTSLESVNFNNLNTSKVTNMSYMFRNTKISDLDISSFSTTKAENMVGMFDAMPLKRIKFGNFDFKITNIKSYPFGRGTWIREEDGKEYAAVDLVRDSSTKNISGTYKKVRNIIDEMSVPGSVTYRFDRVESIENFTTSNSEEIGFLDNQHIYLKNLPSSNIKDYKVTGSASVIAKNCIRDVNNNQYHLKITVDNIHVYDLVETDSSKIYGRLMGIERTSIALQNYFYSNLDDFRNMTNRILAKTSYAFDVTLEILNQNNEPVNGNYLFSIYDLDTPSPRDADTGLPSHVDGEGYGDYSEGITLQEGYDFSTIKFYSRTFLKVKNKRIYGSHSDNGTELSEMLIKTDAKKFKFTWTGNGCGTRILAYYQPQRIEFVKQDENGGLISGAKLSVYDNTNTLVSSWTTANESKYLLLNPGKYTLKEETTPNGYETSSNISFHVDIDGSVLINNSKVNKIVMTDNFKKYSYTVNYLDKETNNPIHDPKTVNNVKYTTKVKSSNEIIDITNYKYNSADKEELTINVSNNVINLYYDRLKGKVIEKHIYENTNAILYEKEHILPVGDEYNISSRTFENFELVENRLPENARGIVKVETQEVIYYYQRLVKVEIAKQDEKVKYVLGAKLSLYDSSNNIITSWITANEPNYVILHPGKYILKEETTPDGYEKSDNIKFIIDNDGNLIIDDNPAIKVVMVDNFKKYSYTINYLDKVTNKPLHNPKTVNYVKFGTIIKAKDEIINIDNYIYDSADKEELTISVSNNVINLYYDKPKGKVTEKHIDENTNGILYEEEHILPVGNEYNIPSKTFDNYALNEDRLPSNAKGIVKEESQEVIYYYRRIVNIEIEKQDETGAKLSGAKLSIYNSNNNLITSWTTTNELHNITLNPGTYTLKEEEIPEHYEKTSDIKFMIDNDGNIIIDNNKVNKIIMIDDFKSYPYTVNYLDKETKKAIHDSKIIDSVKYGTVIKSSEEIINVPNYKYNSVDKEELRISGSNNVINIYYDRIKGGIVEKHVDEIRNVILDEEEHILPVGEEYNIPSKIFENYVLMEDKLPTNAKGIVKEEGQEVIYYYRKIVNVITKVTNEGGTIVGDEKVLEEEDSTPNKIVIKADDNHYIEKVTINGEEIEITDNKEMILENFKAMKEDKIVEVSFGEIIKEVPKTDKNTILPIISIIVLAVGMLIVIIQSKKFKKN